MTDIIWGNVGKVESGSLFELNVTHRKDGNKSDYLDNENIVIDELDVVTIPQDENQRTKEMIEEHLAGKFVKCEINEKTSDGQLRAKVSHSGQGGY